jgi:chorismate dehydratase
VSYLNARPLTDGLEAEPSLRVVSDVPSRLLGRLLAGEVEIALCPIIDYQRAPVELCIVPVGAIGSEGQTLTVRLFADRPFSEVSRVAVDGDSRTSVALLQVLLRDLYGTVAQLEPLPAGPPPQRLPPGIDAILLIGDKVVTAAPSLPYQLDLGEAWRSLTGLPFVFATWLSPITSDLGELPELLRRCRDRNRHRVRELAAAHAGAAGWPVALAEHYLGIPLTSASELGDRPSGRSTNGLAPRRLRRWHPGGSGRRGRRRAAITHRATDWPGWRRRLRQPPVPPRLPAIALEVERSLSEKRLPARLLSLESRGRSWSIRRRR